MGRQIRMVPADWDHPRDERGEYIPLHTHFPYNEAEIAEGLADGWLDASKPNYGMDIMPQWTPRQATHVQLYENTTEGTPLSPIFDNIDDLCAWAAENATTFADWTATADEWKSMLMVDFVHHREGNTIFM